MVGKVQLEDLDEETKARIGIPTQPVKPTMQKIVSPRLVALGRVLQDLQGLDSREAMWVLRKAIELLKGYRERVKKVRGSG